MERLDSLETLHLFRNSVVPSFERMEIKGTIREDEKKKKFPIFFENFVTTGESFPAEEIDECSERKLVSNVLREIIVSPTLPSIRVVARYNLKLL